MANREYVTTYRANDQASAVIDAQIAKLLAFEVVIDRVTGKLGKMTAGVAAAVNGMGTAIGNATAKLGAMEAATTGATAKIAATEHAVDSASGALAGMAAQSNAVQLGLAGMADAAVAIPAPLGAATMGVGGFTTSMVAMRAAMFVLREVREGLDAIAESAQAVQKYQNKGAESGLSMRDQAREFANLRGASGPTNEVMQELFELQIAGGLKFEEALKFGEQFRGSATAGLEKGNYGDGKKAGETQAAYAKRVDPLVEKIQQEGAKFASRIGIEEATAGDLTGLVAQYGKTPDVKTAAGHLEGFAYGLNEGRGKISKLQKGALGAASTMIDEEGGRFKSLEEIGVAVGVAAVGAKTAASAGTKLIQSNRLLQKFATSEDPAVKALGVTDQDSYIEALRKVAPTIQGPEGDRWLRDHGFTSATERDAGRMMAKNLPVMEHRLETAHAIAKNGDAAMAKNEEFKNATISGQNRQGEARKQIAEYHQTEARQAVAVARKFAVAELRREGKITTDDDSSSATEKLLDTLAYPGKVADAALGTVGLGSGDEWKNQRQQSIDARAAADLIKKGKQAGLDLEAQYPGLRSGTPQGKSLDQVYEEVIPKLQAKGIGFGGDGSVPAQGRPPGAGAGVGAAGGAGAAGGNAGAAGVGPQASIDASDLKEAARALLGAAGAIRDAVQDGGGSGGTQLDPVRPMRA